MCVKHFCILCGLACKANSCAEIRLTCFSVEIMAYRLLLSLTQSCFDRLDSFLCCHSNRQKPYHPDQNSLTSILRRHLSKQALALLTTISDFFIYIRSIPVRKEWFATPEQQQGMLKKFFPILKGIRLCVGASHVHPKLGGRGQM